MIVKNILDIKSALEQSKQIISRLEKENLELKNTLAAVGGSVSKDSVFLRYQHIHHIRK